MGEDIIVLIGKMAVGKSIIERELAKKGFSRAISYTTRKPRLGEKDGVDYFFVSNKEFDEKFEKGEIFERTLYEGEEIKQYGLGKESFKKETNNVCVVNVDGLISLNKNKSLKNKIKVFYIVSDDETRLKRIKERDQKTLENPEIKARFSRDKIDFDERMPNIKLKFPITKIKNNEEVSTVIKKILDSK